MAEQAPENPFLTFNSPRHAADCPLPVSSVGFRVSFRVFADVSTSNTEGREGNGRWSGPKQLTYMQELRFQYMMQQGGDQADSRNTRLGQQQMKQQQSAAAVSPQQQQQQHQNQTVHAAAAATSLSFSLGGNGSNSQVKLTPKNLVGYELVLCSSVPIWVLFLINNLSFFFPSKANQAIEFVSLPLL